MLTNRVLLKAISDMKGITGADISAWDLSGTCLTSTDEVGEVQKDIIQEYIYTELEAMENKILLGGYQIQVVMAEEEPECLLLFEGLEGDTEVIAALCVNQLENLMKAYKEPLNKQMVLSRLLKGNLVDEELVQQAARVRIANKRRRVAFVIEPKKEGEEMVAHTLKNLYVTGITDFIVEIDKSHIIFIKELSAADKEAEIQQIAYTIVDTLSAETMVYVRVAYGTSVEELQEVERSYREARMALDVGKSFYAEKTVLAYRKLGIGRLVHQLSIELCEEFLLEILGEGGLAQFDDETMLAVYKFFDYNLNISETARQLYVHRNTLTYRLEKIQKAIGLDVRTFEDAMTFKLAIMVSNHIHFKKNC